MLFRFLYCTPPVLALAVNFQMNLIQVAKIPHRSTLATNLSGALVTQLLTPNTNTFIAHHNASLGHHWLQIPKAQGKTKVRPNALDDDCRWIAVD
jgi:hypothetical protein